MKKLLFIIFPLFLVACELTVVIDLPEQEPKAVINAFFAPDSAWRVEVVKSRAMYDTAYQFSPLSNATVRILKNGQFEQQLSFDSNRGYFYSNQHKPTAGDAYSIEVSDLSIKDTASAIDTIPAYVAVNNFVINKNISITPEGDTLSELKFDIDDPGGPNYYSINLLAYSSSQGGGNPFVWNLCYQSNDPVLNSGNNWIQVGIGDNSICERIYFSDDLIDGNNHQFSFKVNAFDLYDVDAIFIVLSSISKSYFNYSLTRDLQINTGSNPFAEPVIVYNNVSKGFGIFAGYNIAYAMLNL